MARLHRETEAERMLALVLERRERETFTGAAYWVRRCERLLDALRSAPVKVS